MVSESTKDLTAGVAYEKVVVIGAAFEGCPPPWAKSNCRASSNIGYRVQSGLKHPYLVQFYMMMLVDQSIGPRKSSCCHNSIATASSSACDILDPEDRRGKAATYTSMVAS